MQTLFRFLAPFFLFTITFIPSVAAEQPDTPNPPSEASAAIAHTQVEDLSLKEPLFKPFIERYILDELRDLRQQQQVLRADIAEKVAAAKLEASDRALRYTADTTNNIFYIITAAASILVLLGWRSIRDIRENIEVSTARQVADLTQEYETRLNDLERSIKERSDQIMAAQQKISDTNLIHSLWMRSGLEKSEQEKIKLYDQILEVSKNDVEALTYKADVLLDINEEKWALSLANQALEQDSEYALAYWQRACAQSKLGQYEQAIDDIIRALELSESLREEVSNEAYFDVLREHPRFVELFPEATEVVSPEEEQS
ncbi:hypothetical protein VST7929_02899 [Vibrio stylophorae]|uniref:Tetratricopeptide repeat protein n=1 Tax=Vibrio stylophorae TaxID=659351 RepID=A0ABM8ZX85_9VIBR|nr:hypothetical protein [Vibrio stylophorae]CAH0535268.1 hypothetical protein VST7929_02899 [Vibrio stylophorae]